MSITYETGDIFTSRANVIVHQCNCFNKMGGGIAKVIAQKYPQAQVADQNTQCGSRTKFGSYSWAATTDGKVIINLYSQFKYGKMDRFTDYEAMYKGLKATEEFLKNELTKSIAISRDDSDEEDDDDLYNELLQNFQTPIVLGIPYLMGCGLAGGDWNIVEAIIKSVFGKSTIDVVIVKLPTVATQGNSQSSLGTPGDELVI